jgi:GNAT superfamily N-acetyltransferase
LHRAGGEVIERDDCVVVRSPGNEGFYWGNCLMIPDTPADDDLGHWLRRFHDEVAAGRPGVRHVAIGVNSAPPSFDALPAWRAAGFEFMETVTLRLRSAPRPPADAPRAAPLELRAIEVEREFDTFVDLQAAGNQGFEPTGYRRFRELQMRRIVQLRATRVAEWFGLWCGPTLVADAGLLMDGRLGRFQSVLTHPDWRRRGLCRALVGGMCRWAIEQRGMNELLMCADPEDIAIDIYESLGFERFDREWGLQRHPPEDADARRSVRLHHGKDEPT